jgi:uncharacterized protein YecT (DUF1311 family)
VLIRSTIVAIACVLLVTADPAGAATRAGSSTSQTTTTSITQVTYDQSCEKNETTNVSIGECVGREYDEVKSQLAAGLALESGRFGKRAVAKIQKEWLNYMQSSCATFPGAVGGSAHGSFVGECELELTIDRLIDVRKSLTFNPLGR